MSTYLSLKWTTSRAHDTYGYNVITLTDERTGKKYRAMGGGYDMVGTVFADWLSDTHRDELRDWAGPLGWENPEATVKQVKGFYGAIQMPTGRVRLDGACGLDSIMRVARALGLEIERTFKPTGPSRGETTGWFVS
ncbi:MAG TPA: hypothetical protein VJW23_03575 [Propionibacteriaceae bacterium]|nr:hypothetical protein [Propionibacteriaceae bacterium]